MSAYPARPARDAEGCEGLTAQTPVEISNRPGLSEVSYRVGTHARFKQSMLARISAADLPGLGGLNTRDDEDPAIALLDAWAAVADVLAFYGERIANESYLRTATERLSLLHLGRLIGYELRPGVAASVDLAFTLEDAPPSPGVPDAPRRVTIAAGARVQSIPGPGERPQTFETVEGIEARPHWNALRPRLRRPQTLFKNMGSVTLEGMATGVAPGDSVLIVAGPGESARTVKTVLRVSSDPNTLTSRLDFEGDPSPASWTRPLLPSGQPFEERVTLTQEVIQDRIIGKSWAEEDLRALATMQGWDLAALEASIRARLSHPSGSSESGAFAFRQRAALFGHNAPRYDSLPSVLREIEWYPTVPPGQTISTTAASSAQPSARASGGALSAVASFEGFKKLLPAFPTSWENLTLSASKASRQIHLDNVYPGIVEGGWVVLRSPSALSSYRVQSNVETTRSDYTLTAKVSRLTLGSSQDFTSFKVRETTVLARSEVLPLADVSITEPVRGDEVLLDGPYFGLNAGRRVMITGERADLRGVRATEDATLAGVRVEGGYTLLVLREALVHAYVRDTVTLNANVAGATHGESAEEIIGGGDTGEPFQSFTLRQAPLTHIAAPTPGGTKSTLEVRVDGLLWEESDTLYGRGPDERVYVTRIDDEGRTIVQFGDGRTGARPPTGAENIRACYRKGMGEEGLVVAGQLSLPMTRPLGVRGVTNPLPASGAAGRETHDEARRNAPLTVLTLDRIVSLQDYEDFARAYGGIARALATWTWDGRERGVFVTVAGTGGAEVAHSSRLRENLMAAMRTAGDPRVLLNVESYRRAAFRLGARVGMHPDYLSENVLSEVERRLADAFGFEARGLGQAVALSEVIAIMGTTPGVTAVDVDALYRDDEPKGLYPRLIAATPRAGSSQTTAAELLLLDLRTLDLGVMT